MREENKYSRLLSVYQIKDLYTRISTEYITQIDLRNSIFDREALENSFSLLVELGLVSIIDEQFFKSQVIETAYFEKELLSAIESVLIITLEDMFACEKHFDVGKRRAYVYRNEIKRKYLGLLMLLEELNAVERHDNRIYFHNKSKVLKSALRKKKTTKEELEKTLELEARYGEEAEQFVLRYEKDKLTRQGIDKDPIQVSLIDVAAGYDVLSYFSAEDRDNKYIEVKSCDRDMQFFISANEIEKAQLYGNRYYLYLYDRTKARVEEICNPYFVLFASNDGKWSVEAQSYKIKKNRYCFKV